MALNVWLTAVVDEAMYAEGCGGLNSVHLTEGIKGIKACLL